MSESGIRILQIEDSKLDAELVLSELDADAMVYQSQLVTTSRAFSRRWRISGRISCFPT